MILPGWKVLRRQVITPALDHVDHAVGEELGVDAQVLVVGQVLQHRVGDAADTHLQGGAVGDHAGNVLADLEVQLGTAALRRQRNGVVHLDDAVQPADVDEAVAQGARHLPVDLGDDDARFLGRGFGGAHLDAEAAEAVLVWRRQRHQRGVQRQGAARPEEIGNLRQKHRREIGPTVVDRLAHVVADEQRVVAKGCLQLRSNVGRVGEGQDMHDLDVAQLVRAAGQALSSARSAPPRRRPDRRGCPT